MKALKDWFAFIIVRKFDKDLYCEVFEDMKIFYLNSFYQIFNLNFVGYITIVAY